MTNNISSEGFPENVRTSYESIGINTKSKHFERFYNAGLLRNIDYKFVNEVRDYWQKYYNKQIDPVLHLAFLNLTGKKELRLIPSKEMWNDFIPYFNDMNIRIGYSDKNLYEKLIKTSNAPKTILKRVHGNYYNSYNQNIEPDSAMNELLFHKKDMIIKPSDGDNGKGIAKLIYKANGLYLNNDKVTFNDLGEIYGFNFIVQDVIEQHPTMAAPHPASINSLRMVTFRWENKIEHILTYARFGGNNNVKDHAISGGVSVGVNDEGELMDFAIDTNCNVHKSHPTTNYSFAKRIKIPNYDSFKTFVVKLHEQVLHHDYVSWDIAVGIDGDPILIEPNFRGTGWRYQLVSQTPIFGNKTEDVLRHIKDMHKKGIENKSVKSNLQNKNKKLREQHRKVNKEVYKLKKQLKNKENEINHGKNENKNLERKLNKIKKEYNSINNSRWWKLTKPGREIGAIAKKIFKKK